MTLTPVNNLQDGTPYWRRNLAIMWLSQFLSLLGFSLSLPFAPFFIRALLGGDADEGQVRAYAALSAALSNITFAVMAPIWGVLADKYGRKPMVLRANFAGAVIVALMGLSPNVFSFLFLRALQGMFTGTMSASMTLVVSCAPSNRQGYALGVLSTSVFSGDMTGLFIGGLLANTFGFRPSFFFAGIILGLSGLLVLWLAKENFIRPIPVKRTLIQPRFSVNWQEWRWLLKPAIPLFILFTFSTIARYLDNTQFALFVENMNGGKDVPGAAKLTSWVLCMGSIGAMLSGLVLGRFIDNHPKAVAKFSSLGAAAFMGMMAILPFLAMALPRISFLGQSTTYAVLCLLPLRFLMIFCSAGLEPVWNAWLSKITHPDRKGIMFGFASTARSFGCVLAHLSAGGLAFFFGVRSIFFVGPLLFLLLIPLLNHYEKEISAQIANLSSKLGNKPKDYNNPRGHSAR